MQTLQLQPFDAADVEMDVDETGDPPVLKMLALMEQSPDSNHDPVQDFLSSGRTGRRNAMPDILGEHASTSTAELPARLQLLNTAPAGAVVPGDEATTPVGGSSGSGGGAPAVAGTSSDGQPQAQTAPGDGGSGSS